MPLADVDKVHFEITVRGTLAALGGQSQSTVTPFHYIRTTFANPHLGANAIAAFHTACQAELLACCNLNWSWDRTTIRCLNSPTETEVTANVGLPGGIAGDMLPSYCAGIITKKTALRGRSYRGRSYIPGVPETGTTGNAATAGQLALYNALADKLDLPITAAPAITYIPAVLSRKLSNLIADPSIVIATPILDCFARSVLGRLSSRKSRTL